MEVKALKGSGGWVKSGMESTEKAENECLWMVWLGEKNEHRGNFTFRSAGRLVPAFTRHARALRAPQLNPASTGFQMTS